MLNWLYNLKFEYGFVEISNYFTESLIDFYNSICVVLICIIFLIGFWLIYILVNHIFKQKIKLNKFSWSFV